MKNDIRERTKRMRESLDHRTVDANSRIIGSKLLALEALSTAERIGIYYPAGNEVSTLTVISRLLQDNKRVFLPRVKGEALEFREIRNLDEVKSGSFRLLEPGEGCKRLAGESLNILIVPCVAVDRAGNRIGRGRGYYDRFLAGKGIRTICLAHHFQLVPHIPTTENDQKMDIIITEKETLTITAAPTGRLLDGKKVSEAILARLHERIVEEELQVKLAVILVGNNPSSELYVKVKRKRCEQAGIGCEVLRYPSAVAEETIKEQIGELNADESITGILVQLPLPTRHDTNAVLNAILPRKDVDGLTMANRDSLARGDERLAPPTPKGILRLFEEYGIKLEGRRIVIVGNGNLVGRPLSLMLKNRGLGVTVCDKETENARELIAGAEILISGTGTPHLIRGKDVREGCVVVDAGSCIMDGKTVGDVMFDEVKVKASWITPNPGGVGPMTIVMLMENILNATKAVAPTIPQAGAAHQERRKAER
jgi:methylenetetrahydrofolate dehydrogenase (NADP+)/methenyltetrahydrofolate cyclohydrolase